jgi:hypothetical protein
MQTLKKRPTDPKASNDLLRDLIERFLYGLATLIFCTIPFLISGGAAKERGIIFFAEIILLLLGIVVFGIVSSKNTPHQSKKNKHS